MVDCAMVISGKSMIPFYFLCKHLSFFRKQELQRINEMNTKLAIVIYDRSRFTPYECVLVVVLGAWLAGALVML